uniref:Uncharacterized protein n=1 Tax=Rhodnius prolixus TaxID=13249 RepID=T1HA24_RHOPR
MDKIHKVCKRRTPQVKVGNWRMRLIYAQSFPYAEDVVLLASSKEHLLHSVAEWCEMLKWKGMALNVSKSNWKDTGINPSGV